MSKPSASAEGPSADALRDALRAVPYPGFSRDIVSFGLVKDIVRSPEGLWRVFIELGAQADDAVAEGLRRNATEALVAATGLPAERFEVQTKRAAAPSGPASLQSQRVPGATHVVAIASGKGGVGKSAVAANLAAALHRAGHRVGLLDCDLYGPSQALMLGGAGTGALQGEDGRILPIRRHGIQTISMGHLLGGDDQPVILRGPLATRYTQQLLMQVAWEDLDVLLLDLPPGTGDIQLTIVQSAALDGGVIVTTPQEIAVIDARKAAAMFERVNVPVLGVVENMAEFQCPSCGMRHALFGTGGGAAEADRLGAPLLARLPLDPAIRESADAGRPIAFGDPGTVPAAAAFRDLAAALVERLGMAPPAQ